ncbi:C-C motif chemokine 20-like [Pholidichthys leucotaenia]
MTPGGKITVIAALLLIEGILSPTTAARPRSKLRCCTSYSKMKPLPIHEIKGYREQTAKEHCRIDAIIFFNAKGAEMCTNPKDPLVKKYLALLSSKLKTMSKSGASAHGRKTEDGSGSFFITEASPTSTEF